MAAESLAGPVWRTIVFSTVAAASVYLALVLWAGRTAVIDSIRLIGTANLSLILALSLANYGIRFLRWHWYLRTLGSDISAANDLRVYLGGFALTTTPGKAGEMARSLWLLPFGVSATSSLAAFIAERVLDLIAIMLLSGLGVLLYRDAIWLLIVAGAAIACAYAVLYSPAVLPSILRMPPLDRGRLARLVAKGADVLVSARRCLVPSRFIAGLLMGLLAWGAEATGFYLLLDALGHVLPLATAFSIYGMSMLAGAISFMPGGLGGSEAAMILMLKFSGVATATAVSATLLVRLATLWFAVFVGIVSLSISGVLATAKSRKQPTRPFLSQG